MKPSSASSSSSTRSKYIAHNNDIDDETDNAQVNNNICTNDVLAFKNNECKLINHTFRKSHSIQSNLFSLLQTGKSESNTR